MKVSKYIDRQGMTSGTFRSFAWNNWALVARLFFEKSFEKIQFSLKSDKNNGRYTWVPMYMYV